jgi:cation diffusion facilitator family transporter
MGHSHSHHHHHDHTDRQDEKIIYTPEQKRQQKRRRIALWTFCWLATCGSSMMMKRSISKADWLAFGATSIVLSSADKLRRYLWVSINKLIKFKDGIVKHSPGNGKTIISSQKLQEDAKRADRVTWIGVVVNMLLSIGKLSVGVTQHSSALVADAGHSLSDLVSDFITLWTVQIARLPADEDHPYGHWKFEAIGSLFLSLTLIATAFSVGSMANKELLQIFNSSSRKTLTHIPGPLALVMAGISIASKEWLYRITNKVGEQIKSSVVIANAWHHRSDAYSSVLALGSIAWARTGFPAADAAAGLLVAGMIGMTGGDILMQSVQQLSDGANPLLQKEAQIHCAQLLTEDQDDVENIDFIRARQVGSLSLVEVQLTCPMHLSTTAARAVEERWKYWLKEKYDYEATVNAKPNVVVCPLLVNAAKESAPPRSAGSIEFLARQQALLSSVEVERVTVHYQDCQNIVDVIAIEKSNSTLPELVEQGHHLKETLQELQEIDEANIFWDLSLTPRKSIVGTEVTSAAAV